MSANIITFESQYMAEQMKNIDKARQLTQEAIEIMRTASHHRRWQCPESAEINNGMQTISNRMRRIDTGIMRVGNALGKGLVSFTELEDRSMNNANTLSDNLRNNYGFTASIYGTQNNTSVLPVTYIQSPYTGNVRPDTVKNYPPANTNQFIDFWHGVEKWVDGFFQNVGKGIEKVGEIVDNIISGALSYVERFVGIVTGYNRAKTDDEIRLNESINQNVVDYQREKTEQKKSDNEFWGKIIGEISSVISLFKGGKS